MNTKKLRNDLFHDYMSYKFNKRIINMDDASIDLFGVKESEELIDGAFKSMYTLINEMMDKVQNRGEKHGDYQKIQPLIDKSRKSIVNFDKRGLKILKTFEVFGA